MQNNYETSDELQHYGVLGMKWGVRRGKADKVYAKASKKLTKLDEKATKHQKKAIRRTKMGDSTWYARDVFYDMAKRSSMRAAKKMKKANKLVKNMEKALKDTPIKLTNEQVAIGRRYIDNLNMQTNILVRY